MNMLFLAFAAVFEPTDEDWTPVSGADHTETAPRRATRVVIGSMLGRNL